MLLNMQQSTNSTPATAADVQAGPWDSQKADSVLNGLVNVLHSVTDCGVNQKGGKKKRLLQREFTLVVLKIGGCKSL
jgi:hypothetical protein